MKGQGSGLALSPPLTRLASKRPLSRGALINVTLFNVRSYDTGSYTQQKNSEMRVFNRRDEAHCSTIAQQIKAAS